MHLRPSAFSQSVSSLLCSVHVPFTYCFSLVLHYTEQLHGLSLSRESHHLAHVLLTAEWTWLILTQSWTSHCRVSQSLIPILQAECRLALGRQTLSTRGEEKQAKTSREADTTCILLGALSVTAQMLPYAAHHGKQSVNKNPGASETFRERLPNYWNADEWKNKMHRRHNF